MRATQKYLEKPTAPQPQEARKTAAPASRAVEEEKHLVELSMRFSQLSEQHSAAMSEALYARDTQQLVFSSSPSTASTSSASDGAALLLTTKDHISRLQLARTLAAVVDPLDASIRELERVLSGEDETDDRASSSMDGWGACSHTSNFFEGVLDGLQMSSRASGKALAEQHLTEHYSPAMIAEGSLVIAHRSVRLRVERAYDVLREVLGSAYLHSKDCLTEALEEVGAAPQEGGAAETATSYLRTRMSITTAQQWLLEEFLYHYQALVAAVAAAQKSQRSIHSAAMLFHVKAVEEQYVGFLSFFRRFVSPSLSPEAAPSPRWSQQLLHSRFFTSPPLAFPTVTHIRPAPAEQQRGAMLGSFILEVEVALPHTPSPPSAGVSPPRPLPSLAQLGIHLRKEKRLWHGSGGGITSSSVLDGVSPMWLLSSHGRLLAYLIHCHPNPFYFLEATPITTSAAAEEQGKTIFLMRLGAEHFSAQQLRDASLEVTQHLASTRNGCLPPQRLWGRGKRQLPQSAMDGSLPPPLIPTAGLTPPATASHPLPLAPPQPPQSASAVPENEQQPPSFSPITAGHIITPPSPHEHPLVKEAIQRLTAEEPMETVAVQASPSVSRVTGTRPPYLPCTFDNHVQLLWITTTCMVLQRPSTQQPWGLAIECLEDPEEFPRMLPMRLIRLPPRTLMTGQGAQASAAPTPPAAHPFLSYFTATPRDNWYIDSINGVAARHPDHALPLMSSLTRMVMRFRRL